MQFRLFTAYAYHYIHSKIYLTEMDSSVSPVTHILGLTYESSILCTEGRNTLLQLAFQQP
jgi:hypothetical protein